MGNRPEGTSEVRRVIVDNRRGGGRWQPHNYGDADQVELETLGCTVYVLSQYAEVLGRPDERVPIEPDAPVQVVAADHLAGRDPVLTKAIALRSARTTAFQIH